LPEYNSFASLNIPEYIENEGYTDRRNMLYVSKYEQSMPIMLPKLQYRDSLPFIYDDGALKNYNATPLITHADTRLFSLNSSNQYGYPSPSFVLNTSNTSDFYVYKYNINRIENGSNVDRSFNNRSVINYKQIITDYNVFNPSNENILTWAENSYAKYALIYGKDPNNIDDVKVVKVIGGDDGESPNVSIFMNYTGFSNYNDISYNGIKVSYIDTNYPVKLVVNDAEDLMFSARHSICNDYINIFNSMNDMRNNSTYGFDCYHAIPMSNFKENIFMPYNSVGFGYIENNNGDAIYARAMNLINSGANSGGLGYKVEIDSLGNRTVYNSFYKLLLPDSVKNTAYDFKAHRAPGSYNYINVYFIDSNDPYHIHKIYDATPEGVENKISTIGSANDILTYNNTLISYNIILKNEI
jgi:hypothetical protein